MSYMVSDLRPLSLVSTDDGHVTEGALPSSLIHNRAAAAPELLVQHEVLHSLWRTRKRT